MPSQLAAYDIWLREVRSAARQLAGADMDLFDSHVARRQLNGAGGSRLEQATRQAGPTIARISGCAKSAAARERTSSSVTALIRPITSSMERNSS